MKDQMKEIMLKVNEMFPGADFVTIKVHGDHIFVLPSYEHSYNEKKCPTD